jgi:glutamate decarboxylase
MNQPELFIFNFRFVPKEIMEKIDSIMMRINSISTGKRVVDIDKIKLIGRIEKINVLLNDLNIELHKELREEDNSFVSRTTIDCPHYFSQNTVILRAVTINPLTTPEILQEIIDQLNRLGLKIYKNQFAGRLEKI